MEQRNMRTTDSRAVLALAFALTLAAGVAGGLVAARAPGVKSAIASAHSPLDELQLSADQTRQMRTIWEAVRDSVQGCQIRGQTLRQQRDRAMESLLTDEQKARFEKVAQDYNNQILALNSQREATFQSAVTETTKILNDQQRLAYKRILRTRTGREPGQPLLDEPPHTQAAGESMLSIISGNP
jgi:Spy/CpxP family protein refolding chaperone